MARKYQETEIEFRKLPEEDSNYPEPRGLVVYQYGGNLEKCIEQAREDFLLGEKWVVVRAEQG